MKDILTQIDERDARAERTTPNPKSPPWSVLRGNGKPCRHRYTYHRARKLAARFNRLYGTGIAYATR